MSEAEELRPVEGEYAMRFAEEGEAVQYVREVQAFGGSAYYRNDDPDVVYVASAGMLLPARLTKVLSPLTYRDCDYCQGEGVVTYLEGPGFESKVGFGFEPNERTIECPACHGSKLVEVIG